MTDDRIFELNCEKLKKHFKAYCLEMGMEYTKWTHNIYLMPPMMMEGTSPKRLIASFVHRNTAKILIFRIANYGKRGYKITQLT